MSLSSTVAFYNNLNFLWSESLRCAFHNNWNNLWPESSRSAFAFYYNWNYHWLESLRRAFPFHNNWNDPWLEFFRKNFCFSITTDIIPDFSLWEVLLLSITFKMMISDLRLWQMPLFFFYNDWNDLWAESLRSVCFSTTTEMISDLILRSALTFHDNWNDQPPKSEMCFCFL